MAAVTAAQFQAGFVGVGTVVTRATTAVSAQATLVAGTAYIVTADVTAYLKFGAGPTASQADADYCLGEGEVLKVVSPDVKCATLRAGGADGYVYFTPSS